MFKGLKPILYGGREVWPLVEGGKGVSATNHMSSGAWAAAGGIGTVSAVNADSYDAEGKIIPQIYKALTRRERHEELIAYAIEGAVQQVKRAFEISGGKGAININVLWEMGGAQRVLHGVLEKTKGMVAGVTCGAGMPYKLSEIAASYNVSYLPIVSSGRAFRALWKRSYHKVPDLMAAVVYEDPWLAGGHNGLSNSEDPLKPEDPYPRVKALRDTMRAERHALIDRDDVEVQVEDGLAGRRFVELGDADTVRLQSRLYGQRQALDMGNGGGEDGRIRIQQVTRWRLGDDQQMALRLREDVHHHEDIGVLVDLVRRNLAADDLAEDVGGVVGGHPQVLGGEARPAPDRAAFLRQQHVQDDGADQRQQPQQLPPAAAAGVVQAARTGGQ